MNFRKVFFIKFLILFMILSFLPPTFAQVKRGKTVVGSGVIELVSRDRKLNADYIMINERKILVPSDTKIVDEWGNALTLRDLRPGLKVVVEAMRNSAGSYERKITVKK